MAQVNQRLWKLPGQRTKRKAWGFTAQINGKQVRRYKTEWTQDEAEAELAKALLKIEPEKPKGPGITLAQGADRYLAGKARKRTIEADRRQLDLLKAELGDETPLARWLTEDEARRLLAACRKSRNAGLAGLVEFCLFTGLRQGEASWLVQRVRTLKECRRRWVTRRSR